jgi:hypothetical protein
MKDVPYERLCRVDGQKPTARERWTAFHRLWRIAHGRGVWHDMEAGMCFRVLFGGWRSIHLLDGHESDGLVDRSHIPTFLRKTLLEGHRRQRLYAGHYEWRDRDKTVANKVRDEHGIEVTPLEVAEVRYKLLRAVRARAAEDDVKLPADDEDLLRWLAEGRNP